MLRACSPITDTTSSYKNMYRLISNPKFLHVAFYGIACIFNITSISPDRSQNPWEILLSNHHKFCEHSNGVQDYTKPLSSTPKPLWLSQLCMLCFWSILNSLAVSEYLLYLNVRQRATNFRCTQYKTHVSRLIVNQSS